MRHAVFISYAKEDASEQAYLACSILEQNQVPCWIAPRDVTPGTNYIKTIADAIEASEVLLVLISPHAKASEYVLREVGFAVEAGISVTPFRLENADPGSALRLLLQFVQWCDGFPPPLEDRLTAVIPVVKTLISNSSPLPQEEQASLLAKDERSEVPVPPPPSVDQAELEISELAEQEIRRRGYKPAEISRNLLIFSSKKQKTWLSFTSAGVFCFLDNRAKGGQIRCQWFQRLDDIEPASVSARDREGRTGLLNIGRRYDWLYTKALFGSGEHLKNTIVAELSAAERLRSSGH